MSIKKLIEFELDGQPVYVEAEVSEAEGMRRVSRGGGDEPERAESRFVEAVARIKPAAEAVLNAFREMNTPDEIALEFGLNFSAKAGVAAADLAAPLAALGQDSLHLPAGCEQVSNLSALRLFDKKNERIINLGYIFLLMLLHAAQSESADQEKSPCPR